MNTSPISLAGAMPPVYCASDTNELIQKFLAADRKVTRIENSGGVWVEGYGKTGTSKEYDEALLAAQELYTELEKRGVNPFA